MKSSLKIGFMHISLQGDGEPAFSSGRTPGLWGFGFHNVTSRSTWSIKSRYQFSASQLKHLWIHHLAHSSFLLSWAEHDVCECLWNWNPRQLVCPGSFEISLCTTIFHIGFSEVFVLNVIGTTGASLPCNLTGRTVGTFWKVVKFYV